jgi:hypothetical protein
MPWIHATLSSSAVPTGRLAQELAQAAANAAGLEPGDVIALVTVADAGAVRRVVATATGLGADRVAVVRS